jgi:hypothetical protein
MRMSAGVLGYGMDGMFGMSGLGMIQEVGMAVWVDTAGVSLW